MVRVLVQSPNQNSTTPSQSDKGERMSPPSITQVIEAHRPDLVKDYVPLYKQFHSHPELSMQEHATARKIVQTLHSIPSPLPLSIHTHITPTGLVAILRNGPGPTILLRADIDALPIAESTHLPYASTAHQTDAADGVSKPTMHACGHDLHIVSLLAATHLLASCTPSWSGTLVSLFQPGEERGVGALAMVNEGLYTRSWMPVPDIVLGGHVMPFRAGYLCTRRGVMLSAADSFKVTLFGRGGHASLAQRCVDPVLMAASTVVRLQGIVSREVGAGEGVVVTVGCIRAGESENVIPETAELRVNVRTVGEEMRERVLESVRRIVKAESVASGGTREPEVVRTSRFPLTECDTGVVEKLEKTFTQHFGDGKEEGPFMKYHDDGPRAMESDDFPILGTSINRPYAFWFYGGIDQTLWDNAEKAGRLQEGIPVNHSAKFAPVIMPTLQVATDAYAAAALTWLLKKE